MHIQLGDTKSRTNPVPFNLYDMDGSMSLLDQLILGWKKGDFVRIYRVFVNYGTE